MTVPDLVTIDGSEGEGGGQMLRTSLALSVVTGRPLRVHAIRAGRERPGLLRQHLACVRAAAAVGAAEVVGDALGSTEIAFHPRGLVPGAHRFVVGSAGSAILVLQTVLPALWCAPAPSTLVLEGGTHNPAAPPYDFLVKAFLPLLERMGPHVSARLERVGFYPAGGGRLTVEVRPSPGLAPLHLPERGALGARTARVLVANVPSHVAGREVRRLASRLPAEHWRVDVERLDDEAAAGNAILLEVVCAHATEVFSAFGARGIRAETVADTAVDAMRRWLAADVPVGPHLADQLLLPLALAGLGSFLTTAPTPHTVTNQAVIGRFLKVPIEFHRLAADRTEVRVGGR